MRAALFVVFATLTTLMPALVVAWNMGAMAPFWLLSGDAYLYLGIGEASQGFGLSFDGERPTNGFHPLWQVLVRLVTVLAGDPLVAATLVAWGGVLCTLGGVLVLGMAIRRWTDSWLLAMLVVPGVYYLVIGQALGNLPVWAFFDGMEAGLALLVSGLVLWQIAGRRDARHDTPAQDWALGLLIAVLVMTRLDEIFVPAALSLTLALWPGRPLAERLRQALRLVTPAGVAVVGYVAWSVATTGMFTPVSGAAKGEGALVSNAWVTLATFFAPLIDLREGLTDYSADRAALAGGAFRVVELLIPALFALGLMVALWRRHRPQPWAPLLAGLCGGIVYKAAYNLLAVNYWHQATWYFALATAVMSLGTALLLAPAVHRLSRRGGLLVALSVGTMSLLHASLWTQALMTDPLRPARRDFWLDRAATEAAVRAADPTPHVLEFGDGMINFSFGFPVRHGFVFAGDGDSLAALRAGRLLSAAHADGYHLLSSYEYLQAPPGAETWDSDTIRDFLHASPLDARVKSELEAFDFAVAYIHRPSGVPFFRMTPR